MFLIVERKELSVNKKGSFKNVKVAAAFHGWLSLKNKKIPKILRLMQFPCSDALSYAHLAEEKRCCNSVNKFGIYTL